MSRELENELSLHFKGLKRKLASDTAAGFETKNPMSFGLYQFVGKKLLTDPSKEMIFKAPS
jgi:hypothetical protein